MAEGLNSYKINMIILKRIDPQITNILARVDKVSLYAFCSKKNEWEDNGINGEFFICSRNTEPYSSLHILNHKKKKNFTELIFEDWDWNIEEPLLLYRKDETIFGIEFYDMEDYTKITTLVSNLIDSSKQKQEPELKGKLSSSKIMNVLNQAQQDFQKISSMIENQYKKSQPSTSKMNMNFGDSDGSNTLSSNKDTTTNQKNEANETSHTDVEELETLASALSLMEKTGKPIFINPGNFENKDKKDEELGVPDEKTTDPLDRQQMQEALMNLIKNDSDFLSKLHETYVNSCLNLT